MCALVAWALVSGTGLADPLFVPSPLHTMHALHDGIATGVLPRAAGVTCGLALLGFALGAVIGVPLGMLLGGVPAFRRMFGGMIDALRSVPSTALFPLFLVLFGIGHASKVTVATFVAALSLAVFTASSVPGRMSTRRFLCRFHRTSLRQRFVDGMLFPALPGILGGLRVALSASLVVTIANEMVVGAQIGLGRLIFDAQSTFRIPEMYAGILVAGVCGIVMNVLLGATATRLVKWQDFDRIS